jgi:uncharacterized protein YcnI
MRFGIAPSAQPIAASAKWCNAKAHCTLRFRESSAGAWSVAGGFLFVSAPG